MNSKHALNAKMKIRNVWMPLKTFLMKTQESVVFQSVTRMLSAWPRKVELNAKNPMKMTKMHLMHVSTR